MSRFRGCPLRVCLGLIAALACVTPESRENQIACEVDADCTQDLTVLTEPLGTLELVGATCELNRYSRQPACNCQLRKTPFRASEQPYVFSAWAGTRPGGCSEYGRVEGCLYCASEFRGCEVPDASSVGDAHDCDSTCADLAQRMSVEFARAYSARVRANRCIERRECKTVLEIEGKCYVGGVFFLDPRAYDCSASDEELLAQPTNIAGGNSCR